MILGLITSVRGNGLLIGLLLTSFSLPPAEGQLKMPSNLSEPPRHYVCFRARAPVRIDGLLDDDAWKSAQPSEAFVDIEGDTKPAPRFRTDVQMAWDDSCFYIGAALEEPHVWATLTKRDTVIFHDNDFEVFIDPNGDNHEYYEMEMNALNTVWDLFLKIPYRDGGKARDSWDIAGLQTAVHVDGTINNPSDTDKGWTVEIAMPWSSLKTYAHRPAPPRDGDQWRVNFSRVEWTTIVVNGSYQKVKGRPEDNWVWSPQGVVDMHRPEMWGYVEFTSKPMGEAVFHPDPSLPVRQLLMRIYYDEKEYRARNGRWSRSVDELNDPGIMHSAGAPVIALTDSGYVATAVLSRLRAGAEIWHVREDSRIWKDE